MAQIQVNHLTFYYEGSYEEIFNDVSFRSIRTGSWGLSAGTGEGKLHF